MDYKEKYLKYKKKYLELKNDQIDDNQIGGMYDFLFGKTQEPLEIPPPPTTPPPPPPTTPAAQAPTPAQAVAQTNENLIKIRSFNAEGFKHEPIQELYDYINKKNITGCDVFCLQEIALQSDLKLITPELQEAYFIQIQQQISSKNLDESIIPPIILENRMNGINSNNPHLRFVYDGFTGGILYDSTKYDLIKALFIKRMPPNKDKTKPSKMCLVLFLRHVATGQILIIANIHLKAEQYLFGYPKLDKHNIELTNILEQIISQDEFNEDSYLFLAGDFNEHFRTITQEEMDILTKMPDIANDLIKTLNSNTIYTKKIPERIETICKECYGNIVQVGDKYYRDCQNPCSEWCEHCPQVDEIELPPQVGDLEVDLEVEIQIKDIQREHNEIISRKGMTNHDAAKRMEIVVGMLESAKKDSINIKELCCHKAITQYGDRMKREKDMEHFAAASVAGIASQFNYKSLFAFGPVEQSLDAIISLGKNIDRYIYVVFKHEETVSYLGYKTKKDTSDHDMIGINIILN